jgi:peptide/nickel transport system permease protein
MLNSNKNFNLRLGACITACMVLLILIGFFWTPFDPNARDASVKMAAPSLLHILGTDNFGRDIFSRVLEGAGTTLTIAAATVAIGVVVGVIVGGLTGYFGGWLDEALMRVNDVVTAFPSILLALVLISLLGPGKYNVILALGLLFIPSFARIVRGEVAKQRDLDYVRSARLMGVSHLRILFVHILPNTAPVLLSSIAIGFNNAVLAEASMSYLSIGVMPPDASLGLMLNEAQAYFFSAPWYALSAGCAIVLLILGFGLLSDGLGGRH